MENFMTNSVATKNLKLNAEDIQALATGLGSCFATDMITVLGKPVGYMYRDAPDEEGQSGWIFLSGEETQEYLDDPAHMAIYDVNFIANCDPDIVSLLDSPFGVGFEKTESGKFVEIVEED